MTKSGYVHIVTNRRNGTLYIGVTSDLPARIFAHREGLIAGFTKRYGCKMLVWYACFDDIEDARNRELQMKEWRRAWKIEAIEKTNPDWLDLYEEICV
jgi:putative endonuclease